MAHVVVVGASVAGLKLAQNLRTEGFDGAITLVDAETDPLYDKPPLSKAYLTHSCAADGTLGGAMAVASYHSVADEVVPFNGTEQWASQTEVDALWLQKNGCVKEPHLFRT